MSRERKQIVYDIAVIFSDLLQEELGDDLMVEIASLNNSRLEDGCADGCASHDFVDANQIMLEAFGQGAGRNFDIASEEDVALWSEAWDLAKAEDFFVDWGKLYYDQLHPEAR